MAVPFSPPKLALCFQGVSFSLTPSTSSSSVTLLPHSPIEPMLQLVNFTGVLRVSSIKNGQINVEAVSPRSLSPNSLSSNSLPHPHALPPRSMYAPKAPPQATPNRYPYSSPVPPNKMVSHSPAPDPLPLPKSSAPIQHPHISPLPPNQMVPSLPPLMDDVNVQILKGEPTKKRRGRPQGSRNGLKKKTTTTTAQDRKSEGSKSHVKFVGVTDGASNRNIPPAYTTPIKRPMMTAGALPAAVPTPTPVKNPVSYPSQPNDPKPSLSLGQSCESQPSQSMSSQITPNDDYDDQPDLDFKPSIVVKQSSMKTISASSSLQDNDDRDDDKSVNYFDSNHSSHPSGGNCQNLSPIVELEHRLTSEHPSQVSEDKKSSVEEVALEMTEQTDTSDVAEEQDSKPKAAETTVQSVLRNILQTKTTMPSPRWGHSMNLIDHSRVLVYGGQGFNNELENKLVTHNDIFIFNLQTKKWTQPPNCLGISRAWHTCTFLPDRQLMLSFGGESVNAKSGKTTTSEQVMVLDTEIMLWYPPTCSGTIPLGRSGHTATYIAHSQEMVVFGGVSKRKWQTVVPVLDTCSWKWRNAKIVGNAPPARSYHSATAIDRTAKSADGSTSRRLGIVIFGGNNDTKSFNSVHLLDTTGDASGKYNWFQPNISGTPPSPRTGHTAVLLEDGKTVLVYGGWDPNADDDDEEDGAEMIFQDSFLLDTELWSWSPGPNPRFFKTETMNAGGKRVGHSAVLAPGQKGTEVLVYGGRIPNEKFASDFQSLSVPTKTVGLFGS